MTAPLDLDPNAELPLLPGERPNVRLAMFVVEYFLLRIAEAPAESPFAVAMKEAASDSCEVFMRRGQAAIAELKKRHNPVWPR